MKIMMIPLVFDDVFILEREDRDVGPFFPPNLLKKLLYLSGAPTLH